MPNHTIGEFVEMAVMEGKALHDGDFLSAGFYHSSLRSADEWPLAYKWCQERFGPRRTITVTRDDIRWAKAGQSFGFYEHYIWTGGDFWFDRIEDRDLFFARWVAEVTPWCDLYDWAIEVGVNEESDFESEMLERFGITIETFHNGWAAIVSDDDLVRARLLRPNAVCLHLKGMSH